MNYPNVTWDINTPASVCDCVLSKKPNYNLYTRKMYLEFVLNIIYYVLNII